MAKISHCGKLTVICELCSEIVRYAVNIHSKCSVGKTQVLQDHEHVYVIIPDEFSELESSLGFYRRNVRSYGVDLKYCSVSKKLTIYVHYSMVAVFDQQEIQAIVQERSQIENTQKSLGLYKYFR